MRGWKFTFRTLISTSTSCSSRFKIVLGLRLCSDIEIFCAFHRKVFHVKHWWYQCRGSYRKSKRFLKIFTFYMLDDICWIIIVERRRVYMFIFIIFHILIFMGSWWSQPAHKNNIDFFQLNFSFCKNALFWLV